MATRSFSRIALVGALALGLVVAPATSTAAIPGAALPAPATESVAARGSDQTSAIGGDNITWYVVGGVALLILLIIIAYGGDDENQPVSP